LYFLLGALSLSLSLSLSLFLRPLLVLLCCRENFVEMTRHIADDTRARVYELESAAENLFIFAGRKAAASRRVGDSIAGLLGEICQQIAES